MKITNNFRKFNKVVRKFYKRNSVKRYFTHNGKRSISYWFTTDWISYPIDSIEKLNDVYIKEKLKLYISPDYFDEVYLKLNKLMSHIGERVEFEIPSKPDSKTELSIFNGMLLTNRDVYYYGDYMNSNGINSIVLLPIIFEPLN